MNEARISGKVPLSPGGIEGDSPRRPFRVDIQALRAVAIAVVVLNHLWPTRLSGGYVGVDVFFVISGFLITGHLFSELSRTGRIALGRFYARRIRRLLPAALLVLAASSLLVAIFLPYARWARNGAEILASATYVENWALAAMSVNYSALNDAASAAQHFWSLSVEEQFYLVWPVLLLLAMVLASRMRPSPARRTVALVMLSIVAAGSFIASVLFTAVQPAQAYFATFTRAWEFALGGLIAITVVRRDSRPGVASLLALVGLAAIVGSALVLNESTPFPGSAALVPALGTAAVIASGSLAPRMWLTPVFAARPVQWLGDVSYSLYLWHWPLIVVAPFALSRELSGPVRAGILGLALALAALTRRWVERPAQRAKWWATSTRRSVGAMLGGVAVVALLAGILMGSSAVRAAEDSPTAALPQGPCVGPNAMVASNACSDPFGPAGSVQTSPRNEYFYTPPECGEFLPVMTYGDKATTHRCDYSNGAPDPVRVWLVGDSHAQQWQGPLFEIAHERGWVLTISYLGGCPVADVSFIGFRAAGAPADVERCRAWNTDVVPAIVADAPDLVITSMSARRELVDDGSGRDASAQYADGLTRDWRKWVDAGSRVLVLADPPFNGEVRSPDCVALNPQDPMACARSRVLAQPPDPLSAAVNQMADPNVTLFDATPYFCDTSTCYAVIGGYAVYYDADHLNLEYARMLRPMLESALPPPR